MKGNPYGECGAVMNPRAGCESRVACNRKRGHKGNHRCSGMLLGLACEWGSKPKRNSKRRG